MSYEEIDPKQIKNINLGERKVTLDQRIKSQNESFTYKNGKRNLQETDTTCPEGELYIRWTSQGAGTVVQTITYDMEVRDLDKAQFYTGIFVDSSSRKMCFFARLDREGQPVTMTYIKNKNYQGEYTICTALTITENQDWLVVGTAADGVGRVSALIVMLDDDLSVTPQIKIWSNSVSTTMGTPNQQAQDVAATSDGGIFVTGYISTAWTQGGYDCFVLRLNYTLDVIYAKSFGTADNEQCYSIQVTRNYDYIYLGGIKYDTTHAYQQMIFYKFNSYTDAGIAVSLVPNTHNDMLTLKNVILTQKQTYSGTNDNNVLYFCGSTDYNNGDIIVGTVTSTSLTTMTVSQVFRYGSPSAETIADCAMTEDNNYMIVLLNTKHYLSYQSYTGTYAPVATSYTYKYSNAQPITPGDYTDPYTCTGFTCTQRSVYDLIASLHDTIREYCEDTCYNELTAYVQNYNSYQYTWTTCDYYIYDYNSLDCSIYDVDFTDCNRDSGNILGSSVDHSGTYDDCAWPLTSINTYKPWYNTQYSPNYCRNDQFKQNIWNYIYGNYTANSDRYQYYQQTFCIQNDGSETNNYCGYDDFQMLFEQDCTGDSNRGKYNNWFIIKIDLTAMTAANIATFPSEAAYFGDRDGDVTGYSIDVDESGFIYISGTSTSSRLGSISSEVVWVYAKTHWRLTFESRYEQSNKNFSSLSNYLNKRFVRPKMFQNTQSPRSPPRSTGTVYTFTTNFLNEATVTTLNISAADSTFYSYQINEEIFSTFVVQPGNIILFTYTTGFQAAWSLTNYLVGDSTVSMDFFPPIIVGKSTTYTQYITLPQQCLLGNQVSGNISNTYRGTYNYKQYETGSSVAGMTITTTTDVSSTNYMSGVISSTEGIYYSWYEGNSYSFDWWDYTGSYPNYQCPYPFYGYFMDSNSYESLRRFEYSVILKVVVDDPQVFPPENKMNIADITPTVGQRYEIANIDTYFTTSCSYMKAKQNKLLTVATSTNFNTTMLPYWMMFYELNFTFEMYPVYTGKIYIDVFCYNAIDQYVVNTFMINPQDTTPINYFGTGITPYTIQYDAYAGVGEYFQWSQSLDKFYDPDVDSDTLDTAYKHTNHTVWLTFIATYINGFDHIKWIGMLFGQADKVTLNNIGTKTFTYQYQDQYSLLTIPTATFSIIINQQPSPTATGIAYSFSDIDPSTEPPDTFFDSYFPFLQNNYTYILSITTSAWFTDADSDVLTYSLTFSDDTDRPNWMGYDVTSGAFRGYPNISDSSQYMNLKFTAYDTKSGEYSYYKTLLVDVAPKNILLYVTLYLGVQRQYAYNFSSLIQDQDGDFLTWSFEYSSDQTTLRSLGVDFYPANQLLSGIPVRTGVFPMIPLKATDPHGYYAIVYFTLIVNDYRVQWRTNTPQYPDQTVTVGEPFTFFLNDAQYFDGTDSQPLDLFASTLYDQALPSWIQFEPTTRCFYGTAPSVQTLTVQVRAMNQYSQDSDTDSFLLHVVANNNPKTYVQFMSDDVTIFVNEWFETTLSIRLFQDYETNRNATLTISGGYGQALPAWMNFNQDNRTLFGQGLDVGIFWVDVKFMDDGNLSAYCNIKVSVLDQSRISKSKIIVNYVLMVMTMFAFILYMSYSFYYNIKTYAGYDKENAKEVGIKMARKRFGEYKDVEVLYHLPTFDSNTERVYSSIQAQQKQQSVYTYDHVGLQENIEDIKKVKIIE